MKILKEWWGRLSTLSLQFMKLMGLGLRLNDPSYIANSHNFGSSQNESAIRVNFYPATLNKGEIPRLYFTGCMYNTHSHILRVTV